MHNLLIGGSELGWPAVLLAFVGGLAASAIYVGGLQFPQQRTGWMLTIGSLSWVGSVAVALRLSTECGLGVILGSVLGLIALALRQPPEWNRSQGPPA